jgi:hypothetical protein
MQLLEAGTQLNTYCAYKSFPFLSWSYKNIHTLCYMESQVFQHDVKPGFLPFFVYADLQLMKVVFLVAVRVFIYFNGCLTHIGANRNLGVPKW